jgi:hypothetical protein
MTKVLKSENAQIHTAAINIRVLAIENRKVTLSVFRQIIEESIVNLKSLLGGRMAAVIKRAGFGRRRGRHLPAGSRVIRERGASSRSAGVARQRRDRSG